MTGPLHQALMFLVRRRLGAVGQQDKPVVGHPVDAAQPGVVQDGFVFEKEQPLLVDRARQDVEEGLLDRHNLLRPASSASARYAAPTTGVAAASVVSALASSRGSWVVLAGRLESNITTAAARMMPPSLSASLAGSAGSRSPKSQVPTTIKYTLPVMLETGPTIEARQRCKPVWKMSMPTAEQPTVTYGNGEAATATSKPASSLPCWATVPDMALIASVATPYSRPDATA